jgi:hypothetical protein
MEWLISGESCCVSRYPGGRQRAHLRQTQLPRPVLAEAEHVAATRHHQAVLPTAGHLRAMQLRPARRRGDSAQVNPGPHIGQPQRRVLWVGHRGRAAVPAILPPP